MHKNARLEIFLIKLSSSSFSVTTETVTSESLFIHFILCCLTFSSLRVSYSHFTGVQRDSTGSWMLKTFSSFFFSAFFTVKFHHSCPGPFVYGWRRWRWWRWWGHRRNSTVRRTRISSWTNKTLLPLNPENVLMIKGRNDVKFLFWCKFLFVRFVNLRDT